MRSISLIKFLVSSTGLPRRRLVELVAKKQVTVNGKIAESLNQQVNTLKDCIRVSGKIVKPEPLGALLLYKPSKVVTTKSDPQGRKTVMDYVPKQFKSYDPVGRLDYWSTGLLVLTNDGDLAYRLTHPKFKVPKVYRVKVSGSLEKRDLRKLLKGLHVNRKLVKFDDVVVLESKNDHTVVRIKLTSGENRVIRRVFDKIYHPVQKLHRERVGPLTLGKMKPGEIKMLSETEYRKLIEWLSMANAPRGKKKVK